MNTTSHRMIVARALLRAGLTAYAAAKQTGLSQSTISRCKVCRAIVAEQRGALTAKRINPAP